MMENTAGLQAELLAALKETPWAIRPAYLEALVNTINWRAGELEAKTEGLRVQYAAGKKGSEGGPVAVINITGVITPKPSLFSLIFGGTPMTALGEAVDAAAAAEKVSAILLNVDSPGGLVDLVPETAAKIRQARETKPVIAVANTDAASAAYWLASQASELYVTPSGEVGSIGVYMAHVDATGWEEKRGTKTTLISAGKYKVEGNPFEALSDEAAAARQDKVDHYYDMFIGDISAGRGTAQEMVREGYGEGRMLTAKDALAAGMVDGIDTLEGVARKMSQRRAPGATAEDMTPATTALKERARYEYHRYNTSQGGERVKT